MTNLIENYSPEIMQDGLNTNKNASFGGTFAVTGVTTISGAASLTSTLAVTGTATFSGVLNAPLGSTAAVMILSATTDTPGLAPQTNAAIGFIKITVAGTSRYIPFYT